MSRICVKNLPKYVNEARLREYFSQKGEITDAKLMRTSDGKSRQFAFIGYRTEQEAQEALKYFDKSFLDASRIQCEIAYEVGDPSIPRPWSRYSVKMEDKSADADVVGSSGVNTKAKKIRNTHQNEDSRLQEFLQVMQPRTKTKLWEDDVAETIPGDKKALNDAKKASIKNIVKEKQVSFDDDETLDGQSKSEVIEPTKKLVLDDAVSDMDYFNSRTRKDWSDSENDDDAGASDGYMVETPGGEEYGVHRKSNGHLHTNSNVDKGISDDIDGEVSEMEKLTPVKDDTEDEVLEMDRLFVRNLPYTATEDDLEQFFSKIGTVSQVHLVLDKQTKRSKGFAYIQYAAPENAARALDELDNSIFQGRLLHILPAKQNILPDKEGANPNHVKNFKEKREEERKASEASGNTKAWNTFFMRPDTVVENIARRFGASKSDFLDPESDDVAVRIALGETQVIAETKKALKNNGINVAALEKFASGKTEGDKRSKHVIIVKNLPYGSTEGELAKMFGRFGSLDKIILPSTKTIAVVIFLEPSEARAAFKGLAYRRYKDAPLYIEWAPADVLDETVNVNDVGSDSPAVGERDVKKQLVENETSYVDVDPDRVESRSIFVKNLNFKTTEESLREHFARNLKEGKICSVKIKKHMKNGKNLSMGFGFIEFDSIDTSTRACKDLQGTVLDGHALILQPCHAKKDEKAPGKTEKDKSSTKIIVRNVAFEATEKDLRQLFSPFGQIKRLRLPRKIENHRGFAFIEFLTKQEAENALQALSSTHLYGRHLVLERAKEGESLEELRQRTAAQFSSEQDGFQGKLSKKRRRTDNLEEGNMEFD